MCFFFIIFDSQLLPPVIYPVTAAATAKSLQSCPTLCDPIDGSPPGSPIPGILQARTLEWVAISSNAWKWKVKVSVVSDPQRPHGLQPTRLLHPWDFLGKSTGVGCHCLLHIQSLTPPYLFSWYWQRIRWLDSITDSVDVNLNKLWETVEDRGAYCAAVHGTAKIWTWLSDWTKCLYNNIFYNFPVNCLILFWGRRGPMMQLLEESL